MDSHEVQRAIRTLDWFESFLGAYAHADDAWLVELIGADLIWLRRVLDQLLA